MALTLICVACLGAAGQHGASVDNAEFKAVFQDGWLVSWTNKRTGETFDFGKPADTADLPAPNQPGPWAIPGYQQEATPKAWGLMAKSSGPNELTLQQSLDVQDGPAQAVQWSVRVPFDQIDSSWWATGMRNRILSRDLASAADGPFGKSYYFQSRFAVLSSHEWRERYFILQGKKGGLLVQVDDPELDHFNVAEMNPAGFPKDVILTLRSIAAPDWNKHYDGSKWLITQYDGWINNAAQIRRDYIARAFDIQPLKSRPTSWVENLALAYVRSPFNTPPIDFPGTSNPDYTQNWEANLKLVDDWLDALAKVVDPDKVIFYVNWWRQAGHDTLFPEHSVDPFFATAIGKARQRGFHVMLHFHNHLVQDLTTFYGRYVAKQDEWSRQAYPDRPKAIGDAEGKVMWGVGYDFIRQTEVAQKDKNFGTSATARQGLPIKMTGYHMSPAYEGWRYMKVAEILSAIRSTGADALHIDVPAVWPEGKERYGINSQQGSREFFKLLRKTLDENGLEKVAIAVEASPGEGYMMYVDMAQLVRGQTAVSILNGINVETMIELQLGDDLDKANELRSAARTRHQSADQKKATAALRFNAAAAGTAIAKMREFSEPNVDAMVVAPFVRAYPHLGAASPLMAGNPGDPAAAVHNQAALSLHTWISLQRDAPFNTTAMIQMFLDKAPWDQLPEWKSKRAEAIKSGHRSEGKIFGEFQYGELALIRWWEKNQPRFAPLPEWREGDVSRFKLANGSTLTVRRGESDPLTLHLAVDGIALTDLNVFEGWKNNEALLKEFGPVELRDQIDRGK